MVDIDIQLAYKQGSWFTANPNLILKEGQHVYLSDGADEFIDAYAIGDGVTKLSLLPWRGLRPISHPFDVTGTSVTLANAEPDNAMYFMDGQKCRIGNGGIITSIVGTTVTFNGDFTGSYFEAIY